MAYDTQKHLITWHICRQLSASQIKGSSITATEQKLVSKYQEHSMSASLDLQMLRVRKMSLDNR